VVVVIIIVIVIVIVVIVIVIVVIVIVVIVVIVVAWWRGSWGRSWRRFGFWSWTRGWGRCRFGFWSWWRSGTWLRRRFWFRVFGLKSRSWSRFLGGRRLWRLQWRRKRIGCFRDQDIACFVNHCRGRRPEQFGVSSYCCRAGSQDSSNDCPDQGLRVHTHENTLPREKGQPAQSKDLS